MHYRPAIRYSSNLFPCLLLLSDLYLLRHGFSQVSFAVEVVFADGIRMDGDGKQAWVSREQLVFYL